MKINQLVGQSVHLYPGDTKQKYGIIRDWNEQGLIIEITKSTCSTYQVGTCYYISHSTNVKFAIL